MAFLGDPIGWLEDAWYRSHTRADIPAALSARLGEIPTDAQLLDFGAGTGHVSRKLRETRPGRYTLAEIDREALEREAQPGDGFTRVRLQPLAPLPFEDATFDVVFLVDVFHHLTAPRATLRELHRVLRPGGILLAVEYDASRAPSRALNVVCRLIKGRWRLWTPARLRAAIRRAGFETSVAPLDDLRVLLEARPRAASRP
jgi:SAM-dependent methyltransferase